MTIMKFLVYFALSMLFIFLSILLGERAPWYFAWLPGTAMIILIAVSGGVLFESQAEEEGQEKLP